MGWARRLLLSTVLVASNALFFAVAVWLLAEGSRVRKAGWLDVFEDDYPWFHTAYVVAVVFLSVLIASVAISGLYSVLCRRKNFVIAIYAGSTLLTALLCVVLTIEGGISLGTARSWQSSASLDLEREANVEANFNKIYCLSQAAYVCTAPSNAQWLVHFGSDDLRDMFLAPDVASAIRYAMAVERTNGGKSLAELCEDESSALHATTLDEQVADLCTWCGAIADLKPYVHLVSWTNSKCPPKQEAASYCVQNVWLNYTDDAAVAEAVASALTPTDPTHMHSLSAQPYVQCRKTFLNYWAYLSAWFLVLSAMLLLFMGVVMRVAWVVLRPRRERYNDWHGRRPERKPLVQLTDKGTQGGSVATSKPDTARAKTKSRA